MMDILGTKLQLSQSYKAKGCNRPPLSYCVFLILVSITLAQRSQEQMSIFPPYWNHRGPPEHRQRRDKAACQPLLFGKSTHSKHVAASPDLSDIPASIPLVETHYRLAEVGENYWDKRPITVLHQVVNSPLNTLSVLEPGYAGSCRTNGTDGRTLVRETARRNECTVAINAGLFSTHTGACLGNIVSDGSLVQDSGGIQNAHFGLTQDGYIFMGYLSEMDILTQDFTQLVGGVMWLVKDGISHVEESLRVECPDTQETGTLERFTSVVSARTAVGHDAKGRVHLIEVNGKTDQRGVNLYELADMLIEMGMVNAINLDGGGSATAVINGTLVNYPSDQCVNSTYNCERPVTTILCVHAPYCTPRNCSGHGSCDMGRCRCRGLWTGPKCNKLKCPGDCSWHGTCTEYGCQCKPGWRGSNCSLPCRSGYYGTNCSSPCLCENKSTCSPVTGQCHCTPGFSGKYCQRACPVGFYGDGCKQVCFCEDSCFCDPFTGNCTDPAGIDTQYTKAGECMAKMEIRKRNLVPSSEDQSGMWLATVLCLSILGVSSLLLNALLSLILVRSRRRHHEELKRAARLAAKRVLRRAVRGSTRRNSENDDEDDDSEDREGDDARFIEEPLVSSSEDDPRRGVTVAAVPGMTQLPRLKKNFRLQNFFSLKRVRLKNQSPSGASEEGFGVAETKNEQLFPLLNRERNGGRKLMREEMDSSSDREENDLFVAPQTRTDR